MGGRAEEAPTAGHVLAGALAGCRANLPGDPEDARIALIDELLGQLEDEAPADVAAWLAGAAGPDEQRRHTLLDVVSLLARGLADGDDPPSAAGAAELW